MEGYTQEDLYIPVPDRHPPPPYPVGSSSHPPRSLGPEEPQPPLSGQADQRTHQDVEHAEYILYTTRYSSPYLRRERGEGERLSCLVGDSCGRRTRDVVIRRYEYMGIYTFRRALPSQLYSVTQPLMIT